MKNKFGRSAILAAIAMVLTSFLGGVLNNILIQAIGYFDGIQYILLVLNAAESMIAFFLAVKFGCKLILKKEMPTSKCLPLSIVAGLAEAVLLFVIPINVALLRYIITFGVFFGFAVIMDKTINSSNSVNDETTAKEDSAQQPKVIANEGMSAQAQFVFNEKMEQIKETAIQIDDMVEAKLFAQAVELQLLKAPATAQFCSLEEMTVTTTGDVYVVSGYVDSQNSYGAIVRTPFKITVFKDNGVWKNADKFINTSAVIQGQIISNTIIWWILGIIGSVITFLIYYFTIMSKF